MEGIVWGYNKLWKIEAKLEDGFCPTWGEMTLEKDGKKKVQVLCSGTIHRCYSCGTIVT